MKNSRPKKPKAPAHLSDEARRWWGAIMDEFQIDDRAGELLLLLAMESFDRMRAAQRSIEAEGAVTADRFGQLRPHPAVLIERDSRTALQRALKQLNLDVMPPNPVGRPAGGV